MTGIRVRILEKGAYQGLKGDITEVRDGRALVKFEGSKGVEKFRPHHLETVVPSVGDDVVVLRGPLRERRGPILKKDRDREEVRLEFNGSRMYFHFDHVSAASPR